jgi:PEP-CTERM motif
MKKNILTVLSSLVLALGAFGQGSVIINNFASIGGITIDTAGNWYSGTFGMEVWMLNGTNVPSNINSFNGVEGGIVSAYVNLAADGFRLEATYSGRTISSIESGNINLGQLNMPDVSPANSQVVLALVAWNNNAGSFSAMLSSYTGAPRTGMVPFVNPTFTAPQPPVALEGWTQDLLMAIPEPSTFALAGLGSAAWLCLRAGRRLKRTR